MPRLDVILDKEAQIAIGLSRAGEVARSAGTTDVRKQWTPSRLDALYELSFLRVFIAWELCLEGILHRSLCGYASRKGQETIIPRPNVVLLGNYYRTLDDAEAAVLDGHDYVLWHDPIKVVSRCNTHIRPYSSASPKCIGLQASIIDSHVGRLTYFGAIRHRIVHGQKDAKVKFDDASRAIAGKPYAGSIPGKLLRDKVKGGSIPKTYLEVIVGELVGLLSQMV